jgi:hypothetical protein
MRATLIMDKKMKHIEHSGQDIKTREGKRISLLGHELFAKRQPAAYA